MLKKDCNGISISTFTPCYAFQTIWPLEWFSLYVAMSITGKNLWNNCVMQHTLTRPSTIMALEVWWFKFYEMALHCTSPLVQSPSKFLTLRLAVCGSCGNSPVNILCLEDYIATVFKASALWADAFYKSKCPSACPSVRMSVCLSVCSLLRYRLNVFLPNKQKIIFLLILPYKTRWKPRFPMD